MENNSECYERFQDNITTCSIGSSDVRHTEINLNYKKCESFKHSTKTTNIQYFTN